MMARILGICDTCDAMSGSHPCQPENLSQEQAVKSCGSASDAKFAQELINVLHDDALAQSD
ncbi:MAG: hypothetical protein GXY49_12460 [Syntrophomonadaceae bacterium]|nr:hypothetical protein [Syntrophomonadaceae bacterium]